LFGERAIVTAPLRIADLDQQLADRDDFC